MPDGGKNLLKKLMGNGQSLSKEDFERLEKKIDALTKMLNDTRWPDIQYRLSMLAGESTARYVAEHMWPHATPFMSRDPLWNAAMDAICIEGMKLEFGVFKGTSINYFGKQKPNWQFHGFDSFEGLPEKWSPKHDEGHFSLNGNLPAVPSNVTLHKGFFDTSLPKFVAENMKAGDNLAFLHIDSDLYSSAVTIFENLEPFIRPGTVILFDEYFGYKGWERDAVKAFRELRERTGIEYEYLGYQNNWTRVIVKITSVGE